ncbi:Cyclopropane-fatty-acyl-phospholipid synthase [Hordeum vulgare]|nr:Cyclopropane-fatty-acyl-phospholipid synthase [Hordeum vulgare]
MSISQPGNGMEFLGKNKPKPRCMERWKSPPGDVIKINLDAAYNPTTGGGGWGAIARDHEGVAVGLAAGKLAHLTDPLHAEIEALRYAIEFAEDQGMGRVIFKTDCSNLQQAISSTTQDRGPLGILFREAKFRLQLDFIEWTIMHCPRMCNNAAHVLAARGMVEVTDCRVWQSNFLDDVIRVVAADLAGPS